ncbi:hypothetical protein MR857_05390 [bacterium]|uniref:hypothetical protein n=1 Tax=Blautia sp. TaxID=1955243 RepID=UPI002A7DD927|nr:hypothetical protein [Blautia sp.]MCI6042770.1 hypothetical protein [bacterium]MDY3022897.1 hypothetical protein [Oliverpabstia sp.]MDY4117556.1 hypothetical protein [Blautia sp.]
MINQENVTAQELVDIYAVIIRSRTVLVLVPEKLNLKMDYEELYENVRVEAVEGTTIMEISVRDLSRLQAEAIVKEILRVSPEIVVKIAERGKNQCIHKSGGTSRFG